MIVKVHFDKYKPWQPVRLPGSKSIAARALICRYVHGLDTELLNLPECDDTRELQAALQQLDSHIHRPLERLQEFGELPPATLTFNLGNGGTSLRFFIALAASLPGLYAEIDCADGLKARPLALLINELRRHGADITYLQREGYVPLQIRGRRLSDGPMILEGNVSSQFLSALLLARPLWLRCGDGSTSYDAEGSVSRPYVEMTRRVMEQFAVKPKRYVIESDWSAASYFYELALAQPDRPLTISSLSVPECSIQGDSACQQFFGWLGVDTKRLDSDPHGAVTLTGNPVTIAMNRGLGVPVTFDMKDTPDLVPALAAGMCMAGLPFDMENLSHLRFKESNRLVSVSTELGKAGYAVRATDCGIKWDGRRYPLHDDETFESWGDHRIAMALAVMAVQHRWIGIKDGEAVSKSFPDFYGQLAKTGYNIDNIISAKWKVR